MNKQEHKCKTILQTFRKSFIKNNKNFKKITKTLKKFKNNKTLKNLNKL